MFWLGKKGIPFSIIFTKSDKLKSKKIKIKIEDYLKRLNAQWDFLPNHFVTSASKKIGLNEVLIYIDKLNKIK